MAREFETRTITEFPPPPENHNDTVYEYTVTCDALEVENELYAERAPHC